MVHPNLISLYRGTWNRRKNKMANGNFVVQNGLTVGPLTINATTGDITTSGNITSTNASSLEVVNTLSANTISAGNSTNTISITGNIVPSANLTYSLGSRTQMFKDVFVGPGTLYVNGKAVIQDNSGTITFSTDANQNLQIATTGSGDLQLVSSTGAITLSGPIKVTAGKYFTSSDGNAIGFSNQIAVDSLTSKSSNTDLVLTGSGTGKVQVNDDMQVTGNLTVSGSTTTINTTNLSVADNIIDLNSTVTSGTPTLDAGIRVLRGDQAAVQLKWSESAKTWQATADGATYNPIVTTSYGSGNVTINANGAITLSSIGSAQTVGSSTAIPVITTDAYGRISAMSSTSVSIPSGALTFTGDVTGTGTTGSSTALTIANSSVTNAKLANSSITVNGTAISLGASATVTAAAGTLTGATLASGVTASSLTSVGTLTNLTVTNTITGNISGNAGTATTLATARNINGVSFNGSADITVTAAAGTLTGATLASGVTASSLTSVGTLTGLTVSGTTTVPSITKSGTNGTGDIGQSSNTFGTVYATTFSGVSTTAKYADLAENYQADKSYAPGTVVMFGGAQEVTAADADTRAVAGVVSTNPAHLMNGGLVGANVVPVALQGRVPCMVIGPVKKGDMLVSAGHGYAKSSANPQMGQVIGKALYDFPGSSKAVIEVVVGRI